MVGPQSVAASYMDGVKLILQLLQVVTDSKCNIKSSLGNGSSVGSEVVGAYHPYYFAHSLSFSLTWIDGINPT